MTTSDIELLRSVTIHKLLNIDNKGRRVSLKCPFHSERTGSFVLYPDGGYHCYGCGKHGKNSIDFCMALGYTFPQTLEELKKYL